MSLKINKLEIENVKRIKAVKIEPTESGLTIIGGKNNQGKTSVLDSIAWALGGERCGINEEVTIEDLAEYMAVTEKTVRNRLKEHGGYLVSDGKVKKKT